MGSCCQKKKNKSQINGDIEMNNNEENAQNDNQNNPENGNEDDGRVVEENDIDIDDLG
jgi:hypothetical protein